MRKRKYARIDSGCGGSCPDEGDMDAMREGVAEDSVEGEEGGPLAELCAELGEWRRKADESRDQYLRSVAEFTNYRRRREGERDQQALRMRMDLMRQLLPVIDDFERAAHSIPPEFADVAWVEGVVLIGRKLEAVLGIFGVEPIVAVGEPFDPRYHSALVQEESDEYPEGTVLEELQKGYVVSGQVLRPTLVKVSTRSG